MSVRCECGKVAFKSQAKARRALRRIAARYGRQRCYFARRCACWHLTSQPSRVG